MKKLLISGFEPFDNEKINPSWEAVRLLPDAVGDYRLTKLRLPVVFGAAADELLRVAEELCPDVIIAVGQAGGRVAITPEMVGINLRHGKIPDNAGHLATDEPIVEGGVAAYFSTLPVRKIVEGVKNAGLPAEVSYSAGAYVCNDVLYTLLAKMAENSTRVGFIHIPYAKEQGKEPSMEMGDIVRGLTAAILSIDD
ncbi:MAG: pyroglutamyl-peptidase I [Clostridia bacterium]|nr:pyroglutamyl-peptidase I [Clostridia bacterium]